MSEIISQILETNKTFFNMHKADAQHFIWLFYLQSGFLSVAHLVVANLTNFETKLFVWSQFGPII